LADNPGARITLDATIPQDEAVAMAAGAAAVTIDCGVMAMSGESLNHLMKALRRRGVEDFRLINVCGQNLIGTGVPGPARIEVHGLMGNHSAAFVDGLRIDTHPTTFPNGVWAPGDAQVAIGNTSNPDEINIGGSVDDLFAAYCPSGTFRVAGQGGNRCALRAGAGVPQVWRDIDYSQFSGYTREETLEDLLLRYQRRKAKINAHGYSAFLQEYRKKVADRKPPVIVIGRRVRDYFMEYAQGTAGIILNLYGAASPAGYYICSGMTAGKVFIRGMVGEEQLGTNVKKGRLTDADRGFLSEQISGFHKTFDRRLVDTWQARLDALMEGFAKDPGAVLDQFVKIVPHDAD